jgi:hypothetical protein
MPTTLNFQAASGSTFSTSYGGNGVAFGNGRWVAGGEDPTNKSILTSTNGTSWSTVSGTTFTISGNGVAYDGSGRWVAVGDNGGGGNTILTSTNGTTWTTVTATNIFTGVPMINSLLCL